MKANRIISCFRQRGKTLSYLLSAFFAVVGMCASAFAVPFRIMPLGDSITEGAGWDGGGYRAVLREKLVAAGYDVDYVGTATHNPGTLADSGDVQHDGHGGWKVEDIAAEFPFMSYAPSVFISAKTGKRLGNVLEMARKVAYNRSVRIPTGQLNSLIADAVMMKHPPSDKGKSLKIYYVAQIGIRPPLFSFKVNSRELMHFSYSRYLENRIRDTFGFEGTSIKFVFREKGDKEDV